MSKYQRHEKRWMMMRSGSKCSSMAWALLSLYSGMLMSTWWAVCSMMWCTSAPIFKGKVRCTVVDTKGWARCQAARSSCHCTRTWVWWP